MERQNLKIGDPIVWEEDRYSCDIFYTDKVRIWGRIVSFDDKTIVISTDFNGCSKLVFKEYADLFPNTDDII
jgi:hypothetical protein